MSLSFLSTLFGRRTETGRRHRTLHIELLEGRDVPAIVWSDAAPLPTARVDAAAVLAADDSIYLLGGNSNSVNVLPAAGTTWLSGGAIDKQRVAPGAGAIGDGRILLFGGVSGAEAIEETYLYSSGGGGDDGASMASTRASAAYATDQATGRIFALGGVDADGVVLGTVEVYDPATDTWAAAAPIPGGRADFAAAADGAGRVFTFGGRRAGYGANDVSKQVFRYDIATNTWQAMAAMPVALRDLTAVAGPNDGKIYLIGGRNASGPVASVYAYNVVTNTWETETSLPAAVADATAVLDADGRILLMGGRDALGQALTGVRMTQDLDATDSVPSFVSSPSTAATSTVAYSYQVVTTGNPQATLEFVTAPSGMTISAGGLITWMPDESHVGTQPVTIRATNRAGSVTQSFGVTVASAFPSITTAPVTSAGTGAAYTYDVNASGAPAATFSLSQAPAAMSINATTGVITWTPTTAQVGDFAVTVVATNVRGSGEHDLPKGKWTGG